MTEHESRAGRHTPGPWDVADNEIIGRKGIRVIIDYGPYEGMRWNGWDGVTPEECTANKALIAAAPELLAALQAYRAAQPQCDCSAGSGCRMAEARALADAALALATSEPKDAR